MTATSTKSPLARKRMDQIAEILEDRAKTGSEILLEVTFSQAAMYAYIRQMLDDGEIEVARRDRNIAIYSLPIGARNLIRFSKPATIVVQRDWAVAALFGVA